MAAWYKSVKGSGMMPTTKVVWQWGRYEWKKKVRIRIMAVVKFDCAICL